MQRLNQRFSSDGGLKTISNSILLTTVDNFFNFVLMTLNLEIEVCLSVIKSIFMYLEPQSMQIADNSKILTFVSLKESRC